MRPLLKEFCGDCHNPKKAQGGVDLLSAEKVLDLQNNPAMWRNVVTQLRDRTMPPSNKPQPTQMQRDVLANFLASTLDSADENAKPTNPGRVLIHRLSRTEYNNTVRDLFGITSRPADAFPADGGGGGGFDNNADTLFVPPILMERYLRASGEILSEAKPERLFVARPSANISRDAAARQVLTHWGLRAFRRPLETTEADRLLRLYARAASDKTTSWEDSVRFALKGVLISPHFLFRVEQDKPATEAYLVSDYELASRLSYFLWSSTPDDTLLALAARKQLSDPRVLNQQIQRMLESPKSYALAENFAGQWLRIRDLYTSAKPDPRRYPDYTPALRDAMYGETIAFFDGMVRQNESVLRLLDADYSYLNEDLARHYGVAGVKGPTLQRVSLAQSGRRGGVLTMGSVLTLTSYPQRTSPVLRGKWVLEEILGTPSPPPPPNAGGLPASDAPDKAGLSFRKRLEMHRDKPQCASCHARMDPIGFGLENFDAVGRWRETIGDQPVDSTGTLATGETFSGPGPLKKLLLSRKEDFVRNLSSKMLAYALGRGLEPYDLPTVRRIGQKVAQDDYKTVTLIREVVQSYPFRYRKNR